MESRAKQLLATAQAVAGADGKSASLFRVYADLPEAGNMPALRKVMDHDLAALPEGVSLAIRQAAQGTLGGILSTLKRAIELGVAVDGTATRGKVEAEIKKAAKAAKAAIQDAVSKLPSEVLDLARKLITETGDPTGKAACAAIREVRG